MIDIKINGAIEITIKLPLVNFSVVNTKPPLIDNPQYVLSDRINYGINIACKNS